MPTSHACPILMGTDRGTRKMLLAIAYFGIDSLPQWKEFLLLYFLGKGISDIYPHCLQGAEIRSHKLCSLWSVGWKSSGGGESPLPPGNPKEEKWCRGAEPLRGPWASQWYLCISFVPLYCPPRRKRLRLKMLWGITHSLGD